MNVTKIFRTFLVLMLVLSCLAATTKPCGAAERPDIVSMLPDNTLAFLVINEPALLFKKAATLAEQLELPMSDPSALLHIWLPSTAHVDMTRPAAIAIHPDGVPLGGVILLPVTDFKAFVKACGAEDADADLVQVDFGGDRMVAAAYNGYAVLTDASDASAIEAVKNNKGGVAAELAAMRERMDAADITGGVTRSGIKKFAALAKQGIADAQAEFAKIDPSVLAGMPPKSLADALSFYSMLVDECEAAVESYAFGLSIEKKAIVGQDMFRLKKSELATSLGELESPSTDWHAQLPAGRTVLVMAGTTPSSLMPRVLEFSKKTMLAMNDIYGIDEDQIQQLMEDGRPLMEKTKGMAFMMSVPEDENAPLYAGAGGLLKVEGGSEQYIDQYIELVTKMVQSMKNSSGEAIFGIGEAKKLDVDGKQGICIDVDFSTMLAGAGAQQMVDEMMMKMLGPDKKVKFFLVAANEDTVAFGYTSQSTVQQFVAAANGDLPRTLGAVPAYDELKSFLPADAQWGGVIDLGGYFALIQRLLEPAMFPDIDVPATPLGLGVTASEQEVCIHGAVSVATIKRLVQTFMHLNAGDQQ